MKQILKELNEVRKFETFQNHNRNVSYVKYESKLTVLKQTEKAVLFRVVVSTQVLQNNRLPWDPNPETVLEWKNYVEKDEIEEIWIPLKCIEGDFDINKDVFSVKPSILINSKKIYNVIPYEERGRQHHANYTVHSIPNIQAWVDKVNNEAVEKKKVTEKKSLSK